MRTLHQHHGGGHHERANSVLVRIHHFDGGSVVEGFRGVIGIAESERHLACCDEPLHLAVGAGDAGLVRLEIVEERAALVLSPCAEERRYVAPGASKPMASSAFCTLAT